MSGSYIWTAGSIQHPYGCKCRLDPNYVPCGCQGAGGYFLGPVNPTEYNNEFINIKNKTETAALKEYQDGLAALAPLGPHPSVDLNSRSDVKYFADRLKLHEPMAGRKLTWKDIYCSRYA